MDDITQARLQCTTNLERDVLTVPPKETCVPCNQVLKVVKHLYEILESSIHSHLRYAAHHVSKLLMKHSRADQCFMFAPENDRSVGMVISQVDDSLVAKTKAVVEKKDEQSKAFLSEAKQILDKNRTTSNRSTITRTAFGMIRVAHPGKIERLEEAHSEKAFASHRAHAQYIGGGCLLDVCAEFQLVAPSAKHIVQIHFGSLSRSISHLNAIINQRSGFSGLT